MSSPFPRLAALALLACMLATAASISPAAPAAARKVAVSAGEAAESKSALSAAEAILRILDADRPELTWRLTGAFVRKITTEANWIGTIGTVRAAVGKLKQRKFVGAGFTSTLEEGVPEGHYCILVFNTEFARATVEEKVVLNLEGGQWRVVGYFVSKQVAIGTQKP